VRIIRWIVTGLVALIIVDFAVSNRGEVTLGFWPLPETLTTELFVPVLLALLLAFLAGLVVAWVWSWGVRRRARKHQRRIDALEREAKERAGQPAGPLIEGRSH